MLGVHINITSYLLGFVKLTTFVHLTRLAAYLVSKSMCMVGYMEIPNQLTSEAIEAFKAIYETEFGESLTDSEAQEAGMRLLEFWDILTKA